MACKLALILVAAFCIFQITAALPSRQVRDTPSAPTQTLDDVLTSIQKNIDQIMKTVKDNEMFRDVSNSLQQFGDEIHSQGQQLIEKVKGDSTAKV